MKLMKQLFSLLLISATLSSPAVGQITGTGTIIDDDSAQGGLSIPVALSTGSTHSATDNDLVNMAVPFSPGEITSCADISVRDAGNVEVGSYTEELSRWPSPYTDSPRSCMVQFFVDMTGGSTNYTVVDTAKTVSITRRAESLADASTAKEFSSGGRRKQVVTVLPTDRALSLMYGVAAAPTGALATWWDGEYNDLIVNADNSDPTFGGISYTQSNGRAVHQYDLGTTLARHGAATADAAKYDEAYNVLTYWVNNIQSTGDTDVAGADTKYIYLEPCIVVRDMFARPDYVLIHKLTVWWMLLAVVTTGLVYVLGNPVGTLVVALQFLQNAFGLPMSGSC